MYDGSKWVKADSSNSNETYKWYDYDNKLWANAVLVTSTNRNTYMAAIPGREIAESDILAYYVWIPRYKYKVWNISKVVGIDSYGARTKGIDIVFENEKESTGTINCTYNFSVTDNSKLSETCTGSNGNYYTHPAFTFGNDELRGFWIGKFELTGSSSQLTVLPNVNSLKRQTVGSFSTMIQNMQASSNIYGLNTSRVNTDSHMLTNYEWGAVAYLTNSKYGRCTNGSCTEISKNGYEGTSNYITETGCGPVLKTIGNISIDATCAAYNTTNGVLASTTENITGVYDMSGGAWEYTMGNMSSTSGSYMFCPSSSSFTNSWYTNDTSKYLTTYAYDTVSSNKQKAYNRGRLGDATSEVVVGELTSITGLTGWYSDAASFLHYFISDYFSWFVRGACSNSDDDEAGVFAFKSNKGGDIDGNSIISSRAALVSLR